jgi:hypothetical protein
VGDLPGAWNDRFAADFGEVVDRPSHGVLQDVHWSVGLFGYFPTYSLGNVYAGCLHAALRRDIPDLDTQLAAGDTSAAIGWLRDKVQRFGALRTPEETDPPCHGRGAIRRAASGLSRGEVRGDLRALTPARHCGQSGCRFSRNAPIPSAVSGFSMFSTMT